MLCFVVLTNILLLTSLIAILSNSLDKVCTYDQIPVSLALASLWLKVCLEPLTVQDTIDSIANCRSARDWRGEYSDAECRM